MTDRKPYTPAQMQTMELILQKLRELSASEPNCARDLPHQAEQTKRAVDE